MQGLITPFTMTVAAQNTTTGSEVKLTRQVQVVSIPVFQFGIYSDSDLSFFNGPQFGFGGRTHTNGNLWLTPNQGPTFLGDKVTVVGEVIRTNLENGFVVTGSGATYGGGVSIALAPDPTMANEPGGAPYTNASWRGLGINEGSVTGNSVYGNVSTTLNNPTWSGTVIPAYNGQLQNHVPVLSLTSTALGGITPISLIRRPVPGEAASAPATFAQRLFSQATLRVLLDDYPTPTTMPGSAGACHTADMMSPRHRHQWDRSHRSRDFGVVCHFAAWYYRKTGMVYRHVSAACFRQRLGYVLPQQQLVHAPPARILDEGRISNHHRLHQDRISSESRRRLG